MDIVPACGNGRVKNTKGKGGENILTPACSKINLLFLKLYSTVGVKVQNTRVCEST